MGDTPPPHTHRGAVWSKKRGGWEGPSREEEEEVGIYTPRKKGRKKAEREEEEEKVFLFPFEILRIVVVMLKV